jgi:curli biogenesis system outer membrane secretion channel CsgG
MRKLTLSLVALAMMIPSTAMACHHAQSSSVQVRCEQGVKVYRATPMAAPAAPIIVYKGTNNDFAAQRATLQSERLAVQSGRIDALENQLDEANRPQRRRIYSAPVGAFGSGGFVNRHRGFKNRRNAGIKVRYNRRIRG